MTRHRTRATSALVAGAAIAGALATPREAEAYVVLGGCFRYDPANDDDGLGVGFSSVNLDTGMRDATEDAVARWNNAPGTPAHFNLVSYDSDTRDFAIKFAFLGATFGAPAKTDLECDGDHYSKDPVLTWNLDFKYPSSPGNYSLFRRRSVTAIHETGHSYGLDHNQNIGCNAGATGLMYAPSRDKLEACGFTSPTSDDTKGATDAHNG